MFYIAQSGEHDCAFACLAMMLANYHKDRNYLFLQHEDKLYSFKDLIKIAAQYDLNLEGAKFTNEMEILKNKTWPIIVILEEKENVKHAVLITKISRRKVYLFDPAQGKRKLELDYFLEVWSKVALLFSGLSKTKCPIIPPDFVSKEDKFVLPFLQILSGLSLFIGTYFIDKESLLVIPIIFFGAFIVFELLFRSALVKAMKKMDDNIASYNLNITKEEYYSFYRNVERYRYVSLSFFSNLIFSLMIVLFLTFVLILNSVYNLLYVLSALLVALLESALHSAKMEEMIKDIENDEKSLKEAKNQEEFQYFAKEARHKAYHISFYKSVYNYLSVVIFLALAIFIMTLSKVNSLTYIVFYLCVSVYLKSTFSKAISYSKDAEQYDLLRLKIINSLEILS